MDDTIHITRDTDPAELNNLADLIGRTFVDHLAAAARRHGVMVSLTISPYEEAEE